MQVYKNRHVYRSPPSVYDDDYDFHSAAVQPEPSTMLDPYSDAYYEDFTLKGGPNDTKAGRYRSPGPPKTSRKRKHVSRSPPPVALSPSEEYLSLSLQPSVAISNPASSKKLLILDLNGTLLLRAPHVPIPRRGRGKHIPYDPYADPTALRPLRKVHPRPFMCCFREFLFHEKTKKWLDTMVWSSAQPHSVQDMVERSFLDLKDGLLGVWARDTLGLAENEYNRKVQTTKDLSKPWNAIRFVRGKSSLLDQSETGTDLPTVHSACTTLLVDDSPLKAQLQPWNHVCVPEYLAETRKKDLRVLRYEEECAQKQTEVVPSTPPDEDCDKALTKTQAKKRRRLEKKLAKQLKKEKQREAYFASFSEEDTKFDETLLAVIGVLDTLKDESNVAGWIRAKGLWAGHELQTQSETDDSSDTESYSERQNSGRPGKIRRLKDDSDIASSPAPHPPSSSSSPGVHADTSSDDLDLEQHWFENRAILNHWVSRGRKALEVLQIPISSGIVE